MAVQCNNLEIVQLLVSYEANITIQDNYGSTPVDTANIYQNNNIINYFNILEKKFNSFPMGCEVCPLNNILFLRNNKNITQKQNKVANQQFYSDNTSLIFNK